MNTNQLTDQLRSNAVQLGLRPPSRRKVRSWIEKGFLPASQPKGRGRNVPPDWVLPESAVQTSRRILEFEAEGVRRATALRFRLWIDGYDFPLDKVRTAITSELNRITATMRREGIPKWMQDTSPPKSELHARRRFEALGDFDSRLEAFRLNQESVLRLSQSTLVGLAFEHDEGSVLRLEIQRLAPTILPLISQLPRFAGMAGLFGDPEEVDCDNGTVLREASLEQLEMARGLLRAFDQALRTADAIAAELGIALGESQRRGFAAVAHSLDNVEWKLLIFVQLLRFLRAGLDQYVTAQIHDSQWISLAENFSHCESLRRVVEPLFALAERLETAGAPKA